MQMEARLAGIPCIIEVTGEDRPMRITGSGFGDAEPPEERGYEVLDRRGRPAPWLERKVSHGEIVRAVEAAEREDYEAQF